MNKYDRTKIEHILAKLEELEYGSLTITVHDGNITQIDTTEKKRFPLQEKAIRK